MVDSKIIVIGIVVIAAVGAAVTYYEIVITDRSKSVLTASEHLPVILVHGLAEDASVWKKWEDFLTEDRIKFYTITFQESDDKCGSALAHARELAELVRNTKAETAFERVNIVGHSKGGIDTRVYLANGTTDVENLIMIGTPNNGTPLAETTDACSPAISDVLPDSLATKSEMNRNTKYWTIAGDWLHATRGNPSIPGLDDGLVAVSSVESEEYFHSLGRTKHQHLDLLGEEEYNLARNVLLGMQ